jgi:hypothetical protein
MGMEKQTTPSQVTALMAAHSAAYSNHGKFTPAQQID